MNQSRNSRFVVLNFSLGDLVLLNTYEGRTWIAQFECEAADLSLEVVEEARLCAPELEAA